MPKVFTIGYGGRSPAQLVEALSQRGISTLVDVRLRPDRAHLGSFAKAKTADSGIEKLLRGAGIRYVSLVELGNIFLGFEDWQTRYATLLERCGDLLTERLLNVPVPFCLMCAEKKVAECHRAHVAAYLQRLGWDVEHIE